jgi:hypothetical protein
MNWRGTAKTEDSFAWNPLPISMDREAMAVLSQHVTTTISMPACIRAALIGSGIGPSSNGHSNGGNGAKHSNGSNGHASNGASAPFQITLKGRFAIGGLGAELVFRGRPKRVTEFPRDVTTKAVLVPSGQAVELHERSARAKVGADSAAWIQIRDAEGVPITDNIFVGSLGRGACLMDPAFTIPVSVGTYISPVGISTPAESDLTLMGEMTFLRGISLRLMLRRREGPLWWGRHPDAVFDFEIVPAGDRLHFPAQPIWTGESAGALRSLIFLDGEGEPIGNEHLLRSTVGLQ